MSRRIPTLLVSAAVSIVGARRAQAELRYEGQHGTWAQVLAEPSSDPGVRDALRAALAGRPAHPVNDALLHAMGNAYDGSHAQVVIPRAAIVDYVVFDYRFHEDSDVPTRSIPAFLAYEDTLQQHVDDVPEMFRENVITIGLEHEFIQFEGPDDVSDVDDVDDRRCFTGLTGLSHVELLTSETTVRGGHFKLESDAGNTLELVSPPLLIKSARTGVPLPSYTQVEQVRVLMERELETLRADVTAAHDAHQIFDLPRGIAALRRRGLVFPAPRGVLIGATNMSTKTTEHATFIDDEKLGRVCLIVGTRKWRGKIGTQVNLATSAKAHAAMKALSLLDDANPKFHTSWRALYRVVMASLLGNADAHQRARLTSAGKVFLLELGAAATNQMAVPAMAKYREYVNWRYAHAHDDKPDEVKRQLAKSAELVSYVKDWAGVWLKTSLYNYGVGLGLSADEVDTVQALLQAAITTGSLTTPLEPWRRPAAGFGASATAGVTRVLGFPALVRQRIANGGPAEAAFKTPGGTSIEILEHVDDYLGPRQDTYVAPKHVAMPQLWPDVTLFVVETRGNTMQGMRLLERANQLVARPDSSPATVFDDEIEKLWASYVPALAPAPSPAPSPTPTTASDGVLDLDAVTFGGLPIDLDDVYFQDSWLTGAPSQHQGSNSSSNSSNSSSSDPNLDWSNTILNDLIWNDPGSSAAPLPPSTTITTAAPTNATTSSTASNDSTMAVDDTASTASTSDQDDRRGTKRRLDDNGDDDHDDSTKRPRTEASYTFQIVEHQLDQSWTYRLLLKPVSAIPPTGTVLVPTSKNIPDVAYRVEGCGPDGCQLVSPVLPRTQAIVSLITSISDGATVTMRPAQ